MTAKSLKNSTKVITKKLYRKKLREKIPKELNINNVYNPKYDVLKLMSTRRKLVPSKNPPRPPNSYFLMKNCYMLALREIGFRFTMPEICIQSKNLWSEAPKEVKDRYEEIQSKAQSIHNELYPEYKFRPRKRQTFKMHVFHESSASITTFSSTNYLGKSTESEVKSPALSSSSNSLKTNYSPTESETSTPNLSDHFKCSPQLPNQLFYIDNNLLNNSSTESEVKSPALSLNSSETNYSPTESEISTPNLSDHFKSLSLNSSETNYSPTESEISTPNLSDHFKCFPQLPNQLFYIDNNLLNNSSTESEVKSPALSLNSSETNYSPTESEISTPNLSDHFKCSPPLQNQSNQIHINNDLNYSFSNEEEFNKSLSLDQSSDLAQNIQFLQYNDDTSYAYCQPEFPNVSIETDGFFLYQEQQFNIIENNENNGYENFH
ncbi:hypothetical protein Glove_428g46 [Diversispora epigaea]|uniref:HMG box domain-containing protein n=1 Tax=Diversispora epigaea TaxID=1348612 RepID=A0A397GXD5_9GLOM|nr:hypothetical protein Glove_428g46 [Diversispora epigaea]